MSIADDRRARFRTRLIELRHRVAGNVDDVVDTINDNSNTLSNLSAVPVHLADIASTDLFADVGVLENQNQILKQIDQALGRVEDGTYGSCESCGKEIPEGRLDVLPFATKCVECSEHAEDDTREEDAQSTDVNETQQSQLRLTGFQAIEFAERESLSLNKAADQIDGEVFGLTIAEAEAIASDRPDLIWVDVPRDEYYGDRKNMKPER